MPSHESRSKRFFDLIISSFSIVGCALAPSLNACAAFEVPPVEARAIAKEGYIYGFPVVDGYASNTPTSWTTTIPSSKRRGTKSGTCPESSHPMTKFVEIPNSDTVYSTLGLDLRAEAMVITVPPIEQSRYYSIQLIDLYTFNFAYTGSRTTGNDGGSFLVAGPSWNGGLPPGIKKVLRCETEFALAGFRTQLFNPGDLDNVKKVQAGYETQPLSQFLGTPAPPRRAKD